MEQELENTEQLDTTQPNKENSLIEAVQETIHSAEEFKDQLKDLPSAINEANKVDPISTFKALSTSSAEEVVTALQNKTTIEVATSDEEVNRRMEENAKKVIDTQLNTTKNEVEFKNEKSFWIKNKSAVKMYGYSDEDPRPNWQTIMMKIGSNVWFVIYWIVATVTVCPLSVFFDVFKAIFKKGWLAMIVATIIYLAIAVGIPLLTIYLPQIPATK